MRTIALVLLAACRSGPSQPPAQSAQPSQGAESVPAQDPTGTGKIYFEFQVEKPVTAVPGTISLRYPDALRSAKISGDALVQFVVDTTGKADLRSFKVLQATDPLFALSAKDAMVRARFVPAMIGGRKVPQLVQQRFEFKSGS